MTTALNDEKPSGWVDFFWFFRWRAFCGDWRVPLRRFRDLTKMNTASSPRPQSIASSLFSKWQRVFRSENTSPESYRVEAAQAALAQAMSPAERVHAIHQAQSAGVPLHEIERELDWADARAAAGIR